MVRQHPDDTIAAISSAPGPGLRAIVRLTGPDTRTAVARIWSEPVSSIRGMHLGSIHLSDVSARVPARLYFWPAPKTYTGQDLAEIHLISSPPLVDRLLADLLANGCRAAGPGEFTQRAFLAGKKDLTRAEAVLAVIDARTDHELSAALAQLAGGVSRPLERLRDDLLNLLADVEAGLDFADEDIEFVDSSALIGRLGNGIAHLTNLRRQLDSREVGGRAIRCVLVGEPNAGKSSLFNALAGSPAALVSPTAGTTRDYLTRAMSLDGVPIELVDTAGWQEETDAILEQAQRLGRDQAHRADVLLWCVPAGEPFAPATASRFANQSTEVLRIATKSDRTPPVGTDVVPASVVTPGGTDAVRRRLTETLAALSRPPLASSQSRCRAHVERATEHLRSAHEHAVFGDPPELVASALRASLDQIGELAGTVHTDDLLDRIFSRFCIGK
jgi:tRNA modification GTPase